jgi:hypothetical protein
MLRMYGSPGGWTKGILEPSLTDSVPRRAIVSGRPALE